MTSYKIKITNLGGLTSRSSAELVEEANHHKCNIKLKLENGDECDLKSIMNVFALSPIDSGETLTVECDGVDEKNAVAGFEKLCKEYSF
ncbi:MAG: HPr family phosphocarrier protein [Bacilli bacterium]|jgi:phosphotransferase system HPr (HPr) family protein